MKIYFIVLLVILTSGHSVVCYSDTCDYTIIGKQYLCGNVCLDNDQLCDCSGQNITRGWSFDEYCCAPASDCTRAQTGAKCSSGEVLSMKSATLCNATRRCFNDVLISKYLLFNAKYTCQDKCIDWYDMCQGLLCAGDEEACGPKIRCPLDALQFNMSSTPVRSFCYIDFVNTIQKALSFCLELH